MNLLAFDTSTDTMSIAVRRGAGARVWHRSGAGGAQASTHLIPAIQQLMAEAALRFEQLDAIAFGRGPGSFTGLRTACSVAQGLAFGAGVPVLPVDSLLAVAEEARFQQKAAGNHLQVLALLDARMDEVYAGHYEFARGQWLQHGGYSLVRPENLKGVMSLPPDFLMAGNAFAVYADRLPSPVLPPLQALPTATAMLRLAPQLLAAGQAVPADQALPTYIRDKVAKTTQERLAEKAAA
jgi:tRNA threonylcarbamoyladenosine biosynthesis protein TsaB